MALYTMYWPDWMCDRARELGLEGTALEALWGGHNSDSSFGRFKVGPGDTVVPITCVNGVLFALASIQVQEKTTGEQRRGFEASRMHGCGHELLVATPGQSKPLRFDRPLTPEQLLKWRFERSNGERPIKFIEHGRLKRTMSLQGVYRVTAATERLLESVLGAPLPALARTTALEQRAQQQPGDAKLAAVLADEQLDAGDARGEVTNLEVALAHETDPRKAAELDARLAAVMRKPVALKKLPGGFPYRALMGGRTFTRLSALQLQLPPVGLGELLERSVALAQGVLDCEGFSHVELLRLPARELEARLKALGASQKHEGWERRWFSARELAQALGDERAVVLTARAPVRAVNGGPALPFQHASQWLRTPPTGLLRLELAARSARFILPIPDGSPVCAARLTELTTLFRQLGGSPQVERLRRTATGDRSLDER